MSVRRFEQIQSQEVLIDDWLILGVFSSAMNCAMEFSGQIKINFYRYNSKDGSCKGYDVIYWSLAPNEEWEAYRLVV